MAAQGSLFGEAEPTDRLFFALFPPPAVAEQIQARACMERAHHRLRGEPLGLERYHITLIHVGDYAGLPPDILAKALSAAERVVAQPFAVQLDRTVSFRNGPFVLTGEAPMLAALIAFRRRLFQAAAAVALRTRASESQFKPHVTLLYDKTIAPERPVEPIGWTAREFVLIHSLLGQTRHIPVRRWSLGG